MGFLDRREEFKIIKASSFYNFTTKHLDTFQKLKISGLMKLLQSIENMKSELLLLNYYKCYTNVWHRR